MKLQTFIDLAIRLAKDKYKVLGEGRNRIVFEKDNGTVIKIPLNEEGIEDNYSEERRYMKCGKTGDVIPYAKCEVYNDDNGIPHLHMERVYPLGVEESAVPEWADFVDCGQVGRTLSGEIVAYDYSDV